MNKNGTVFKSSGVEWVCDVPEHWQVCKLKRLSPVKRGASPRPIDDPKFFDDDGEFSWVRISDVTASRKYLTQTTQKLSTLGSSLSVKLEPETFFVSIAASVGKPIITKIKCCIHDGFVYFPYLQINPDFLYYLFDGGQLFQGLGKLGTQLNLNTETIGSIHIPLPPNDEIQLIVDYLDRETTQIDNLIAAKEQMLTLLEEKREALISHAVTRGLDPNVAFKRSGLDWLGDIPQHWQVSKAKFVSNVFVPQRNKPELNIEDGIPWLTMEDMQSKRVSNTSFKVSQEASKLAGSKILKRGSVIASCVGNLGICTINDVDLIINQQLQAFIPHKQIMAEYFCELVRVSTSYFKMIGTSVTIVYVNQLGFENMPVLLPPKEEQEQIVEHLNREIGKMDKLLAAIKESIALLKERRSALITAAVTGQIALEAMTS